MSNALRPYKISTQGVDMTLELLVHKIKNGDIEIPSFQRHYIWSAGQASKLIESFLLGLPVPQIFLYKDPATHKLLVVDGQQRLRSIQAFFYGKHQEKEFRLSGLESEWDGKTFSDFTESDKRRLKNTSLRATIFEQVNPRDNTSIFEVFERLNTGGMKLTAQEVRNAVIGGDMSALLNDLNKNSVWRDLYGKEYEDSRMRDTELILRLLTLEQSWRKYKKPMNAYLSNFMTENRKMSEAKRASLNRMFSLTIDKIYNTLGANAFRLKKGVNTALADAIFVAFAHHKKIPKNYQKRYEQLLKNEAFLECIEQHTTDTEKVLKRIELAFNAFK